MNFAIKCIKLPPYFCSWMHHLDYEIRLMSMTCNSSSPLLSPKFFDQPKLIHFLNKSRSLHCLVVQIERRQNLMKHKTFISNLNFTFQLTWTRPQKTHDLSVRWKLDVKKSLSDTFIQMSDVDSTRSWGRITKINVRHARRHNTEKKEHIAFLVFISKKKMWWNENFKWLG